MKLAALTAIALTLLPLPSLAQTPQPEPTIPVSLQRYASILEGKTQAELDYLNDFAYYEQMTDRLTPRLIQSSINIGNHACDYTRQEWADYIANLRELGASESRIRISESARIAALTHLCPVGD